MTRTKLLCMERESTQFLLTEATYTGMTRKGVTRSPKESKGVPRSLGESQGVLRSTKEFQGVLRSSENSLCVHYVNEATYFSTAQGVPRSPTEFTETLHGYITQIRQPANPVYNDPQIKN